MIIKLKHKKSAKDILSIFLKAGDSFFYISKGRKIPFTSEIFRVNGYPTIIACAGIPRVVSIKRYQMIKKLLSNLEEWKNMFKSPLRWLKSLRDTDHKKRSFYNFMICLENDENGSFSITMRQLETRITAEFPAITIYGELVLIPENGAPTNQMSIFSQFLEHFETMLYSK